MINLIREVADPSRRSILVELMTGPKSVNALAEKTRLKQPNVSNHLARLRARGMVSTSKVGRQVIYALANPDVEAKLKAIIAGSAKDQTPVAISAETPKSYAREACAGNEQSCTAIVDFMIESRVPVDRIYRELFAPAIRLVGKWFEVEAIDAGQEHLASAMTERMMARVMHYTSISRRSSVRALLAGVAGDYHAIGLRMAADVIKNAGGTSIYLGVNVPASCLISAVEAHRPNLVLLGCSLHEGIAETEEVIRKLHTRRKTWQCFAIGVGGHAARENPQPFLDAGADFVAMSLDCLIDVVLPAVELRESEPKGALGSLEA